MTDKESTRTLDVDLTDGDTGVLVDVALDAFVVEHYDRLVRLARLICRDGPDAADAVQMALEQAWRRRSSLREDGSLRPWLDRIVVREASRIGRSRTSWLGRLFSAEVRRHAGSNLPTHPASNLPEWSALRSAFGELSADQRAVVALHMYAGYSVAETADLVGAPLETVRSRLRLAKDRLRRRTRGARVMSNDERMDEQLRRFLGWQAGRLDGTPDAHGMALRIGRRSTARLADRSRLVWAIVAVALVAAFAAAAALVGSRLIERPPTGGLLAYALNADIYLADQDGVHPRIVADGVPWSRRSAGARRTRSGMADPHGHRTGVTFCSSTCKGLALPHS